MYKIKKEQFIVFMIFISHQKKQSIINVVNTFLTSNDKDGVMDKSRQQLEV